MKDQRQQLTQRDVASIEMPGKYRFAPGLYLQVAGATEQDVRHRLEQVRGVARVVARDSQPGTIAFDVESLDQHAIRPDLARAVVQSGWDLVELRTVGQSLEEIFLDLTKSEAKPAVNDGEAA